MVGVAKPKFVSNLFNHETGHLIVATLRGRMVCEVQIGPTVSSRYVAKLKKRSEEEVEDLSRLTSPVNLM